MNQATKWVAQLALANCRLAVGGYGPGVGQNVANVFGNLDAENGQAVNLWVSQGGKYTYHRFDDGAAGCSTGNWADCGAYTQVG